MSTNIKIVCQNRKARHDYDVVDRWECGIVLTGSEVKSLREGQVQIKDAYAEVRDMVNATVRDNPQLEGTKVDIFVSAPGTSIPDEHELVQTIIGAHQIAPGTSAATNRGPPERTHRTQWVLPPCPPGSRGEPKHGE